MDMLRPDDSVDCALTGPKPETRLLKVDLSQPRPAASIIKRQIREQQQVEIRSRTRITPRPRSYHGHGAYIVALNRPIGDRDRDGIYVGKLHRCKLAGRRPCNNVLHDLL